MSSIIKVENDSYVLKEVDAGEKKSSSWKTLLTLLLFLLSACPGSYNLQDTLWLELPWFEISQPEEFRLASWFLLMQAVSSIVSLALLFTETYIITFSKMSVLFSSSFTTLVVSFLLSFTWHFSLHGHSLFLYLGAFVGQLVGWGQYIFVIPWIANNFNPRLISPFISGNAFMILILVSLQILQEPGGAKNFSPVVYYRLAGIIYAISCVVCVYTFTSGIGRTTSTDAVQPLGPWRKSLWTQTFPSEFWEVKFFTFGRVWMNTLTWTVVPLVLPYASKNTTHSYRNDGESFLQWAVALGYLMLLSGSVLSYIPTKHYWLKEALALNTISNGVILLAAENVGEWSTWTMKVILMTAVAVSKFSWGWFLPLCLRELAHRFPENRELLVRSNSLWHLYSNILCRFLLWMFSNGVVTV